MAMKIPKIGLPQMLKEGYTHASGLEEAVYRNIHATKELTEITRTSLGPNGRNKMVINHLEKLFVTNDAATIMKELDVVHPAAKMVVLASQQQEQEVGDGTNFVVVFAGELLQVAEYLLKMGLHISEVMQGFKVASEKAIQLYSDMVIDTIDFNSPELLKVVEASIGAKQYGYHTFLSKLVIEAARQVMPKKASSFNVDCVRVVKILGGSIFDTQVVRGMVFGRESESAVHKVLKAKVAIFTCALDIALTETKGTVLLHSSKELKDFSAGEEKQLEVIIKGIADAGVKVIVTGSGIGELALHFCNRFGIMVVKILSKFELRRLCRVTGATALTRLGPPMAEEMGYCEVVETVEIGSDRCTVFRQGEMIKLILEEESTRTATIVVRGSTSNFLDDIERAIEDGVFAIKAIGKDGRILAGAGACEIQVARELYAFGEKTPGLNQYSIKKYAEALEVIPRTLAANAGLDSTEVLSKLYASYPSEPYAGVDIESETKGVFNAKEAGIFDILSTKESALRLATHAALTILSVDQIIMSKPAGGPKVKENKDWDED